MPDKKIFLILVAFVIFLFSPIYSFGDADIIILKNGEILSGRVIEQTNEFVKIQLEDGFKVIPLSEIDTLSIVNETVPEMYKPKKKKPKETSPSEPKPIEVVDEDKTNSKKSEKKSTKKSTASTKNSDSKEKKRNLPAKKNKKVNSNIDDDKKTTAQKNLEKLLAQDASEGLSANEQSNLSKLCAKEVDFLQMLIFKADVDLASTATKYLTNLKLMDLKKILLDVFVNCKHDKVKLIALGKLSSYKNKDISRKLTSYLNSDLSNKVKYKIIYAIKLAKYTNAIPQLVNLISSSSSSLRSISQKTLSEFDKLTKGDNNIIDLFYEGINAHPKDYNYFKNHVNAIAAIGSQKGFDTIIKLISNTKVDKEKQSCYKALGRKAFKLNALKLHEAYKTEKGEALRITIISSIGKMDYIASVPFLINVLENDSKGNDKLEKTTIKSLTTLTKKKFRNDTEAWKNWWKEHNSF